MTMIFVVLNGALGAMQEGPKALGRTMNMSASINFETDHFDIGLLYKHLAGALAGDDAATVFRRALAGWDNESIAPWTEGTARNTASRRSIIYRLLRLDAAFVALCERIFPHHTLELPVVIAGEHKRWYTNEIRQARTFYWSAYKKQLIAQDWTDESIGQLDESTTSIVERLSDPMATQAYRSKGLVVGYVQSGKTANFTGVIAKAADAGYKLIIVMAGILDVLRSQTQRRIDKDMIGQELLDQDYVSDADWDSFLKHGAKPSELGSFDLYRLTGPESDYQELGRGVEALKFERANPSKPLWDRDNLFLSDSRIAIIKKNSKILERLLADLQLLRRNKIGAPVDQIPTLIIDDESDQASINVKKPDADGVVRERTATNGAIVDLLKVLPRAQYVGYTATPFANVFVDANSEEDIFPKDFLVSLPRPADYMGVSDFYDLNASVLGQDSKPNYRDYVRPVIGEDEDVGNLQKAVDSFVLSGALKLFRLNKESPLRFRHHTMLVHSSSRVLEHKALAASVRRAFSEAGYEAGPGLDRLEALLENDFRPVSARRASELLFPTTFAELSPHVAGCLSNIGDPAEAVLIVNDQNRDQTPDFDRQAIWKFVVGGTKLSRGYTIEGLTVSYYRRRAATADTLMQMGRWFGFRKGYRDLVRLFIGTEEKLDKRGRRTIDLYEAFGAVCRDEEMFREELQRYASMEDPRILPRQIPPLVPSHMLKPTAPNKMYNARVMHRNYGGRLSESTFAPTDEDLIRCNHVAFEALLSGGSTVETVELSASIDGGSRSTFLANVARRRPLEVLKVIEEYSWYNRRDPAAKGGGPMRDQIEFLKGVGERDPGIDDWLILAPQIKEPRAADVIAGIEFGVVFRSRPDNGNRFSTYNDPVHRRFAEYVTMRNELADPNEALRTLRQPRRAVMIFYAITDNRAAVDAKPPFTPGFTLLFPANNIKLPITFGVARRDQPHAVIVATD